MSSISTIHASRAVSAAPAIPAYFVVMIDYGRSCDAVVNPELTRRDVVDMIISGDYRDIRFIQFVQPGFPPEDVTDELLQAAIDRLSAHADDGEDYAHIALIEQQMISRRAA